MEIVSAVFVAVIFLSSYISFGTANQRAGKTTTTAITNAFYSTATVTAAITGYGPALVLNISCSNESGVYAYLNNQLVSYERNGSISTYYSPASNEIVIETETLSSYPLYRSLQARLGSNATCVSAYPLMLIQLPSTIQFYTPALASNITVVMPTSLTRSQVAASFSKNASNTVGVYVRVLITPQGEIAGNLSVSAR